MKNSTVMDLGYSETETNTFSQVFTSQFSTESADYDTVTTTSLDDLPTDDNWNIPVTDTEISVGNEVQTIDDNIRVSVTEAQIVYILIGIFGMLGNGLSAAVFMQNKGLRKNLTNHFLVSQSLIDFLAAFFLLATVPLGQLEKNFTGVAGYLRCILWDSSFAVWASFLSSTYNLVALSIERYFKIVHPIHHKVYFTKAKAYSMMAMAWSTGIIYQSLLLFSTGGVRRGRCYTLVFWKSQKARSTCAVLTFFIKYLIPIGVTIYCYSAMLVALRKRQSLAVTAKNRDEKMEKAQKNIFKTLVIVVVAFIVCVTWNQILFLIFNLGIYQMDFTSFSYHMSVSAYFINCCVNPVIYVIKYNQFKEAIKSLVCKNRVQPTHDTNTGITAGV